MSICKLIIAPKKDFRIKGGHPWVYGNEVKNIEGDYTNGELVHVFDSFNHFLGKGFINDASQIIVRIISRNLYEVIDEKFIFNKIEAAYLYRKSFGYDKNGRMFYGEADGLPALVIDKFNDVIVFQTLALGIDIWKKEIINAIQKLFNPRGIYERNDVSVRTLEGLPLISDFVGTPFETNFVVNIDGIQFKIDVAGGQKTGFFHDQRKNRLAIQRIVKDATVLDACCYTGSFSMYAAKFGAKETLGIDVSEDAIKICEENARLNNFNQCKFKVANVFDELKLYGKNKTLFDVVMLDPPAFTKSRANLENALNGYREINLRGIQLVKPGGYLVTSSCSHYIYPDEFKEVIAAAAADAKRLLRLVTYNGQSPDHPVIWNIKETNYLKFAILQVL